MGPSEAIASHEKATGLLAALRAVYYPQRTWAAVRAVCRHQGEQEFADWLTGQRERDRHFGDLERTDTLAAVRAALDGAAEAGPARVTGAAGDDGRAAADAAGPTAGGHGQRRRWHRPVLTRALALCLEAFDVSPVAVAVRAVAQVLL